MNISHYFSSSYLFDSNITRNSKILIPLLVLFGLFSFLGLISKILTLSEEQKVQQRYSNMFLITGLFGLIGVFGRYEQLPWLGYRVYLFTVLVLLVIWLLINIIWAVRYVPKVKRENEVESRYQKYLPKAKKS